MKFLEKWALRITCIWLWTTLFVLVLNQNKPLNETGDFMAGMMAPLALFWLVIGFYLQREELKQNTEALLLQAEELKNLVRHNARLVAIKESEGEPIFIPINLARSSRAGGKILSEITFKNMGGQAINIEAFAERVDSINLRDSALNHDQAGLMLIHHGTTFQQVAVKLKYENKFGGKREIAFYLNQSTLSVDLNIPFTNPTKIDEGGG